MEKSELTTRISEQDRLVNAIVLSRLRDIAVRAPTDFGKTFVAVRSARHFGPPILYITPTYASIPFIVGVFRRLNFNGTIVTPYGRDKVSKEVCGGKNCRACRLKKRAGRLRRGANLISPRDAPGDACPYLYCLKAARSADVVIAVPEMLTIGRLKVNPNVVIVDEVDEALQPRCLLLAKYQLAQNHLETSPEGTHLDDALDVLADAVNATNNPTLQTLRDILLDLKNQLQRSPQAWEAETVTENLENISNELLPKEDKACLVANTISVTPDKFKEAVENFPIERYVGLVNDYFERAKDALVKARLSTKKLDFILSFLQAFAKISRLFTRETGWSPVTGKGYIEVWAEVESTELVEKLNQLSPTKIIYLTATPLIFNEPDIEYVGTDVDPAGSRKLVVLVEKEELPKLVGELLRGDYNVLGITTSKWRAVEAKKVYGGKILHEDVSLEEAVRQAGVDTGLLVWNYYGSPSARAVNELGVFDVAVVDEWISRNPPHEESRLELYRASAVELYQAVSRLFRTMDRRHRRRAVVLKNREAFDRLRGMAPNWRYVEAGSAEQALELIRRHVEPLHSTGEENCMILRRSKNRCYSLALPNWVVEMIGDRELCIPYDDLPKYLR